LSNNDLVVVPSETEILTCKIFYKQNWFLPTDEKQPTDKYKSKMMKSVGGLLSVGDGFLKTPLDNFNDARKFPWLKKFCP
jgi:hypothetical protein